MQELQVIVKQEPGTIEWNFEDLKAALRDEMAVYESMVYTDESIKTAQADVAMLRKLRKSVETRRSEIKKKCLEPYDKLEEQAKELVALIDKPIKTIADQVDNYEERRRAAVKAKIIEYMTQAFSGFPAEIAKKAQFACYNARWENKTAKETEWKAAVDATQAQIARELNTVEELEEDFREAALAAYARNLSLTDAMDKVKELRDQREMLIERQRRREEAERQRREAEERRRIMEEAQKIAEQAAAANAQNNFVSETHNIERSEQPPVAEPAPKAEPEVPVAVYTQEEAVEDIRKPAVTLNLYDVDAATVKKIVGYARFQKAEVEIVAGTLGGDF